MFSTSILTYVLVRFFIGDDVILNPGWHTTIYPLEIIAIALTPLLLLSSLLVYAFFKRFNKVFSNK